MAATHLGHEEIVKRGVAEQRSPEVPEVMHGRYIMLVWSSPLPEPDLWHGSKLNHQGPQV